MKKPCKLWIFGDSWSTLAPDYDPPRVWTRQLAHRLSQQTGQEIQMINASLVGSAQDWMITQYVEAVEKIQPDDYVVIVLTSPSRYWYFEDLPSLSNWNILDFDSAVSPERAKAVELYIKHIQRPNLDIISLFGRLSLIAYETQRLGLRRPLVIKGFTQELGPDNYYKELNVAKGNLSLIQYLEYKDKDIVDRLNDQGQPGYFKGADCRFNHMCLSNHDILVDKLLDGLITDTSPDLESGFISDLISQDWYTDKEFCQRELSARAVDYFIEKVLPMDKISSWQRRTGIDRVMRGFGRYS